MFSCCKRSNTANQEFVEELYNIEDNESILEEYESDASEDYSEYSSNMEESEASDYEETVDTGSLTLAVKGLSGSFRPVQGYQAPTLSKQGPIVMLSGMVHGSSLLLAPGYRPPQRLIFSQIVNTGLRRVDITRSGNVPIAGGNVSLSGFTYSVKDYKNVSPKNGWRHYGVAWGNGVATKVGNLVVLQGLLGGNKLGVMATLPKELCPANTLVFNCDSHHKPARVDVRATGEIVYMGGSTVHPFISLSGIVFTAGNSQQKLRPLNGAKNFGAGNSGPRYEDIGLSKAGSYVVLRGMLNSGGMKIGQPICRLPEGARPAGRQKFLLPNSVDGQTRRGDAIRIDVFPDGRVVQTRLRRTP
eukprot:NODE_439_length_1741_cov_4311.392435_g370_i0.p1 GENE.NODE_439_length_1741_cov_4311.392435_g370_i0~~NODE_439_length_1741_cov_4311.392435_g370_i0.p1  ORF type:complete len:368 (+),score=90.07 NODE_439_length_1741_cov_4311.392435_g370_i0:32-1105(+)